MLRALVLIVALTLMTAASAPAILAHDVLKETSPKPGLLWNWPALDPDNFREPGPLGLPADSSQTVDSSVVMATKLALDDWREDNKNQEFFIEAQWFSELVRQDPQLAAGAQYLIDVWRLNRLNGEAWANRSRYYFWADIDHDKQVTILDLILLRLLKSRADFMTATKELGVAVDLDSEAPVDFATLQPHLTTLANEFTRTPGTPPSRRRELIRSSFKSLLRNQSLQKLYAIWSQTVQAVRSARSEREAIEALAVNETTSSALLPSATLIDYLKRHHPNETRLLQEAEALHADWQLRGVSADHALLEALDSSPSVWQPAHGKMKKLKTVEIQRILAVNPEPQLVAAIQTGGGFFPARRYIFNPFAVSYGPPEYVRTQIDHINQAHTHTHTQFRPSSAEQFRAANIDFLNTLLQVMNGLEKSALRVPDKVRDAHPFLSWLYDGEVDAAYSTNRSGVIALSQQTGVASIGWQTLALPQVGSRVDVYSKLFAELYQQQRQEVFSEKSGDGVLDQILFNFAPNGLRDRPESFEALTALHRQARDKYLAAQKTFETAMNLAMQNPDDDTLQEQATRAEEEKDKVGEFKIQLGNYKESIDADDRVQEFERNNLSDVLFPYYTQRKGHSPINPDRINEIERYLGIDPQHHSLRWFVEQLDSLDSLRSYDVYDSDEGINIDVWDLDTAQVMLSVIDGGFDD